MKTIKEKFEDWVTGNECNCSLNEDRWIYHFMRFKRDDHFDVILYQKNIRDDQNPAFELITLSEPIQYVGIYYRDERCIYDVNYPLTQLLDISWDNLAARRPLINYTRELKLSVEECVNNLIGNDRSNLTITDFVTEEYQEKFDRLKEGSLPYEKARAAFLAAKELSDVTFDDLWIDFSPDDSDNLTLSYIVDPEGTVRAEAEMYILKNQEHFLLAFRCNDLIEAEFQKILDNPDLAIHATRKIIQALKDVDAKAVKITVLDPDEKEFTVSMDKDCLDHDQGDTFSLYWLSNSTEKEREYYKKKYGDWYRYEDHSTKEIVRISYRNKVLYEA